MYFALNADFGTHASCGVSIHFKVGIETVRNIVREMVRKTLF